MKNVNSIEKFKPCVLSLLHTLDQSLLEVACWIVVFKKLNPNPLHYSLMKKEADHNYCQQATLVSNTISLLSLSLIIPYLGLLCFSVLPSPVSTWCQAMKGCEWQLLSTLP